MTRNYLQLGVHSAKLVHCRMEKYIYKFSISMTIIKITKSKKKFWEFWSEFKYRISRTRSAKRKLQILKMAISKLHLLVTSH